MPDLHMMLGDPQRLADPSSLSCDADCGFLDPETNSCGDRGSSHDSASCCLPVGQCGVCYDVTCVDGPTRGAPGAEFPDSGCVSNQTISVMITDSCPCDHANKSNKKWCCGDMTHLDLSYKAFGLIADHDKGVVNIMYEQLPFCSAPEHDVNTQTCDRYYGVVYTADVWKLAAGVSVCCLFAGLAVSALVAGMYRKER